jgi:hypothetical protein
VFAMYRLVIPMEKLAFNYLVAYFVPNLELSSLFSQYSSGLRMFQGGFWVYVFIYGLYVMGSFYFFTREGVKRQFQR